MTAASSEYRTLAAPSQGQFREKMSKFIAFAIPVATAEDARSEVARIANEYHDARHVCWAYRLGADGSETIANDNGEPSGTAGKPILGQMRSADVTNVVIAVVRYFGGIKLGTSGLIAAYREAARLAIENATIITACEMARVKFAFPYIAMNGVMKLVKDANLKIEQQHFDNICLMEVSIRRDHAADLCARLENIDGVTLNQST